MLGPEVGQVNESRGIGGILERLLLQHRDYAQNPQTSANKKRKLVLSPGYVNNHDLLAARYSPESVLQLT